MVLRKLLKLLYSELAVALMTRGGKNLPGSRWGKIKGKKLFIYFYICSCMTSAVTGTLEATFSCLFTYP